MAGGDQQFCLRWNNHQTTLTSIFRELFDAGELFDCRIAAEGRSIWAHRILLSACSPYFKLLLSEYPEGNPIFILKDVKYRELSALVDYMYKGEVNISQDELAELLKVADNLKIKGLSESDSAEKTEESPVQKRVATPQPQPSQPIVPQSGTPTEQRASDHQSNLQTRRLLASTDPPRPKKRKRARRRSGGDESGLEKTRKANAHIASSHDSSIVAQPLAHLRATSTASSKTTAVITETQTTIERPLTPDQPAAIPVIVPKINLLPMVLIPKLEVSDYCAYDNDYDDNDMDDAQPGPSHGSEGSSNQGYPPSETIVSADGSVDNDSMLAEEAAEGSQNTQDFLFLEDIPAVPLERNKRKGRYDDDDDWVNSVNDGSYRCGKCQQLFAGKVTYRIHLSSCETRYTCPQCEKSFLWADSLKKHLERGCSREFKCEKCSRRFVYEGPYKRHMVAGCFRGRKNGGSKNSKATHVDDIISMVLLDDGKNYKATHVDDIISTVLLDDDNSKETHVDDINSKMTHVDDIISTVLLDDDKNSKETRVDDKNSKVLLDDDKNSKETHVDDKNSKETHVDDKNSNVTHIDDINSKEIHAVPVSQVRKILPEPEMGLQSEKNKSVFKCDKCSKAFVYEGSYNRHMKAGCLRVSKDKTQAAAGSTERKILRKRKLILQSKKNKVQEEVKLRAHKKVIKQTKG